MPKYSKTNWIDGETILKAEHMQKIEQGIVDLYSEIENITLEATDLSNYYTKTQTDNKISEEIAKAQLGGSGSVFDPTNGVEPREDDVPKLFLTGVLPTTKDSVNMQFEYISSTDRFNGYVDIKCQGTSSMSYAKKNFTIKLYEDKELDNKIKKDFKGWGAQNKFCLKANYVDTTHTRNVGCSRIAKDIVDSRPDSEFKRNLQKAPRNGLIDGFPIRLYHNGDFYGIYTWNIPKDGWMFGMDEDNPNHIVLCGERNTDGNANLINSCQFRKLWTDGDGGDWSVEFGTYNDNVKNSFNRCIGFVMNATDDEFRENIGQYFDLDSLIDYYCFSYFCNHNDGLAKNMLMVTYDGVVWGASLYDMDTTFGAWYTGASFVSAQYKCPEDYQERFSRLWARLEECFAIKISKRYFELRNGALSLGNVVSHIEGIYDLLSDRTLNEEKAKWTSLPSIATNTMSRFRRYMQDRANYVDACMEELGVVKDLSVTDLTLNKNKLELSIPNKSRELTIDYSGNLVNAGMFKLGKLNNETTSYEIIEEVVKTTYVPGYLQRNTSSVSSGIAGEVKTSTQDISTDFIEIDENCISFNIKNTNVFYVGAVMYDENKKYLYAYNLKDNIYLPGGTTTEYSFSEWDIVNIPSNVKYVRMCFQTTDEQIITIKKFSKANSEPAIKPSSQTLVATITPSNAENKNVIWSVDNNNVTITPNGLTCVVNAQNIGSAIVTCTSSDERNGIIFDVCNVTITEADYVPSDEEFINNLFDYSVDLNESTGYYSPDDGSWISHATIKSTKPIEISSNTELMYYGLSACFFNESMNFIGSIPYSSGGYDRVATSPAGAKYISFALEGYHNVKTVYLCELPIKYSNIEIGEDISKDNINTKGYYDGTSGEFTESIQYYCLEKTKVTPGMKFDIAGGNYVSFYNKSNKICSGIASGLITVPNHAEYMSVSLAAWSMPNFKVIRTE